MLMLHDTTYIASPRLTLPQYPRAAALYSRPYVFRPRLHLSRSRTEELPYFAISIQLPRSLYGGPSILPPFRHA